MDPRFVRSVVLPIVFALRREPVLREYRDLLQTEWSSTASLDVLQLHKLRAVLAAAYDNAFYRSRFRERELTPESIRTLADLSRIPILEKSDLPALLRCCASPNSRLPNKMVRKSAGSMGTPNIVVTAPQPNACSLAARYRAYGWYGIRPGDRELRFWGRPLPSDVTSKLKTRILNRTLVDSTSITPDGFGRIVESIHRFRPDYAYGYSSMIAMFAEQYAQLPSRQQILSLKAAVCTAEASSAAQRRRIALQLRCPVAQEYGCSEVDIIAFQCPQNRLHIVPENVLVELIPVPGAPLHHGEVVVTDLNNLQMPLIRYRLGDMTSFDHDRCACGRSSHTIRDVIGRVQGQYIQTSSDRQIHSQLVAYIFEDLVAQGLPVDCFQLIQLNLYALELLIVAPDSSEKDRERIVSRVRRELGDILSSTGLSVTFRFVDGLDLRKPHEKYRHFISMIDT